MTSRASIWYPSLEGSHTADGDADPSVLSPPNHCLSRLVCFIVKERLTICGRQLDKTPSFSHGILFLFISFFFNHFLSCHLPSYGNHLFLNTNAQVVLTEMLPGAPPPLLPSCTGFSLGEIFSHCPSADYFDSTFKLSLAVPVTKFEKIEPLSSILFHHV